MNKSRHLLILILLCIFLSSIFLMGQAGLIHGVIPTKVTAHGLYSNVTVSGEVVGHYTEFLEFWNVGNYGGSDYAKVKDTYVYNGERWFNVIKDRYIENGETEEKTSWKFTGGPNGKFEWWDSPGQTMHIENGKYIIYEEGQYPPLENYPIDNPEAFNGWTEENSPDDTNPPETTEVVEVNPLAPSVDISIIEGPLDIGNGKIKYILKLDTTGNPVPEISITGVSADRLEQVISGETFSVYLLSGEVVDLSVTATNNLGKASDSITLSGYLNSKPTISLKIVSGPLEVEKGKFSFMVEADVTGNPIPVVNLSRDDSSGQAGKNRVVINIAAGEEFILEATADNLSGNIATAQITLSVTSPLEIKLEIVEGPIWLSRVTCYYMIKDKTTGQPLPEELYIINRGKTYKFEGCNGKYKIIIGAIDENSKCEDILVTATVSNSTNSKNKSSASITLPWISPPENMFPETYDYLRISKVKGTFQIKREKDMAFNKWGEWFTNENPKWADTEGVGRIWIGDEIKTLDEPLVIEFVEDGSKFILAPNSLMKITEGGIFLKDGEGSFTITKTKEGIKSLKSSWFSNFSISNITGTSFVLDARNNKTNLKVMEGTVDFYSLTTGQSFSVNSGELYIANDTSLQKKNFNVQNEKDFWEKVEKEGLYDRPEGLFQGSLSLTEMAEEISAGNFPQFLIYLFIIYGIIFLVCITALLLVLKRN
jgi:hypothetical protein